MSNKNVTSMCMFGQEHKLIRSQIKGDSSKGDDADIGSQELNRYNKDAKVTSIKNLDLQLFKDVYGMMSIPVEAIAAYDSLSDDKELIDTYERLTTLNRKRMFPLAVVGSHKKEIGRLRSGSHFMTELLYVNARLQQIEIFILVLFCKPGSKDEAITHFVRLSLEVEDEMKRKRVAGKNEWKTGKCDCILKPIDMDGRIRHIDAPRKQYMSHERTPKPAPRSGARASPLVLGIKELLQNNVAEELSTVS
ncbi:exocyst complex component SEC6 [Tanacetum coccineum]